MPAAAAAACFLPCRALPHATAALTHYQLGNLQLRLLPALLVGSFVGSAVSSHFAVHVPDRELRALFGVYAVSLGASYIRAAAALDAAAAAAAAAAGSGARSRAATAAGGGAAAAAADLTGAAAPPASSSRIITGKKLL